MKHGWIDAVGPPPTSQPASVLRPLSRPLETTDVAINGFEGAPGETVGFDYHRQLDQDEGFCVRQGMATFRTEVVDVAVAAGDVIRFAPGEFQLGRNEGSKRVVALAIGAPRGSRELEYWRVCRICGVETIQTLEFRKDVGRVEAGVRSVGPLWTRSSLNRESDHSHGTLAGNSYSSAQLMRRFSVFGSSTLREIEPQTRLPE